MALTEPTPLPLKLDLALKIDRSEGETYEDLEPEDRAIHTAYYAEKQRRKDPSQPGVAQEALDCVAWLEAQGRSPSEAWETYGYSPAWVTTPARAEETRILTELSKKPSKDVEANPAVALVVADVMARHDVSEFVPKPAESIPE